MTVPVRGHQGRWLGRSIQPPIKEPTVARRPPVEAGENPAEEATESPAAEAAEQPRRKPAARKPKLGSGQRFKALSAALAAKGASDPNALAAVIGRRKFGAAKMASMSAAGRRRG